AQLKVDQGEGLGVVHYLVEVHLSVYAPELFAGQLVPRRELDGAVERGQRGSIAAEVGVADAAQDVLEDAQPGQDAARVEEVQDQRHGQGEGLHARRAGEVLAEDPQADAQGGADGGD